MKVTIVKPDCRHCEWRTGAECCLLPQCFKLLKLKNERGKEDGSIAAGADGQRI